MAMAPSVEKAYIAMYEPTAKGPGSKIGEAIVFQFNPKEYTVRKSASWEHRPARGARATSMPEFKGAEQRTLTIECFLDANESSGRDIAKDIENLFRCCTPLEATVGRNRPSPPFVVFGWGRKMSVTCCVKSVSVKYTLFKPDGTPIRAVATLELQEVPSPPARQNPTSGGPALRRAHTVVAGDSLQSVAHAEYGHPRFWRAIAAANGIEDPMRLEPGTHLLLPTPDEAKGLV
jgi:hypothetical protein